MATQTQATATAWKTYRLTVNQYVKMIIAGIFPPEAHVELVGGILIEQPKKHAPHNLTVRQLGLQVGRTLPEAWMLREEKSLVLGRFWRPEPDIAVIRGPDGLYRADDPKASDVGLLVEVSESTYAYDRGVKWRSFAAARIPIYWIVNLPRRQIEVYRDPVGRGKSASYRESAIFGPDDEISVVIDGQEVGRLAVRDILP